MIKYNNTNNASTTLTAWISASSTTLIVENGAILPAVPFLLTLEHFDNEKVTVREIVKCIAKADNILTIQRGAWTCVQDDSASTKEQWNSAHSFSVGDCASIYWTSEQVQDIQNEIEKKLNIDDFQAWTYVYGATSTWTDAYSITIPWTLTSYAVGQVFRFMADVDNEWNATLNINGLWAVEIRKNHDKILDNGDIEAGQIVEVAYDWTYFQMDSQVATVVDLWNIDSLKMSGVVGELYTLDDELYLQDVSEDLDVTNEFFETVNVWYDNEETHIQRIANGISWNSISLYIAKVWSPVTNFTVEIRKGIYTEADWRAYWTGDENEIIASKSISYSWITETFQKITIVFDEDITFSKWELIDIVCYQTSWIEKIKSTTNYFTIWAYSDRSWEWNSINYVDNWTVTKTTKVVYWVWDFFYTSLLTKVTCPLLVNNRWLSQSISVSSTWNTAQLQTFNYTNNTNIAKNFNLIFKFPASITNNPSYTFKETRNSITKDIWGWQLVRQTTEKNWYNTIIQPWETISFSITFNYSSYTSVSSTTLGWYENIYSFITKWKATNILNVWNEASIIISGSCNGQLLTTEEPSVPMYNKDRRYVYRWANIVKNIICPSYAVVNNTDAYDVFINNIPVLTVVSGQTKPIPLKKWDELTVLNEAAGATWLQVAIYTSNYEMES